MPVVPFSCPSVAPELRLLLLLLLLLLLQAATAAAAAVVKNCPLLFSNGLRVSVIIKFSSSSCSIRRSRTSSFLKCTTSCSMELRSDLSSRVRSSAELVAVEAESVSPWRLPGPLLLLLLLLARLWLWNWLRVAVL
uniref:Secreted protein n=1 Tax=Anopheles darlingi TaxID=43151 RepID=A0A2M4DJF9_ANODA